MLMKILRYEMKRIRLGRLFPIMLVCNCIYALIWLNQNGIPGIAGTAPFSEWTYLAFCGAMLPPAALTLLLLQANYYSPKQQKCDILLLATPCTVSALTLVRFLTLTICFLVLFLLEFTVFAVLCVYLFGKTAVLTYCFCGLLHMLPAVILALAAGGLAGRIQGKLIYVLAAALFLAGTAESGKPFELFGNAFFSQYPLTLQPGADGEPAFVIEKVWLIARLIYLAAGTAMIVLGVCRYHKPKLDRAEAAA